MSFLTRNTLFPQINNTATQFPGTSTNEYPSIAFPLHIKNDHRELLSNPEFLGILSWKLGHMQDAVFYNRRFLADSEVVTLLLKEVVNSDAK